MNALIYTLSNFLYNQLDFLKSLAVAAVIVGVTLLVRGAVVRCVIGAARRIPGANLGLWDLLLCACTRPARSLITLLGFYLAAVCVRHSPAFDAWFQPAALKITRIGVIILATWTLVRFIGPEMMSLLFRGAAQEAMRKTFCMFFSRILKAIAVVFGGVLAVNELGFDPSTLIAGIGLGGLTVALAAQDWASNLFGGAVILFDKPFAVDDWISVDNNIEGVVEDMTFRTTRIRTFDNAQIVVPNALLVSKAVVNWSRMEKRKISFDVGVAYGAASQALAACEEDIKAFLRGEEHVVQDLVSVTFNEFASSSLNIRVHFFTDLTGFADYMLFKERVNMKIAETVQAHGLSFAFPTQTVHVESMPGMQSGGAQP